MNNDCGFRSIFRKARWLFLIMLVFLGLSVLWEQVIYQQNYGRKDIQTFQKQFLQKEQQLKDKIATIAEKVTESTDTSLFCCLSEEIFKLSEEEGISLFVYQHDSLQFWSDYSIPVPPDARSFPENRFVQLGNSAYYGLDTSTQDFEIRGLLMLKTDYPYENRYLKDYWHKDFDFTPGVEVLIPRQGFGEKIFNQEGKHVLSINAQNAQKKDPVNFCISLGLYFLTLVFLLAFLHQAIRNSPGKYKNIVFLLTIPILLALYYFMTKYRVPDILYGLELFSPEKFARSTVLPSLGELLMLVGVGFYIVYNFYVSYQFDLKKIGRKDFSIYLLLVIFALLSLLVYLFSSFIFSSLIVDSSISFETYKVLDLSVYTFIGLLVFALLFTSYALLTDKVFAILQVLKQKQTALLFLVILSLIILLPFVLPITTSVTSESTVFYILIAFLLYYFRFVSRIKYRFSTFVVYVLFFAIFSLFEIVKYTEKKNITEMKMMAVNLSAEHDPVAELLLVDIDQKIKKDNELKEALYDPYFDFNELYDLIQRRYFSGFWDKYDLQITLCRPQDSVYVSPPEDEWYHCYTFFYDYILEDGIRVANTDFYYLDNLNGRISYFAALCYEEGSTQEVTVFIELDTRLISDGLGYPELLLEDELINATGDFSYAKYNEERLITSSGDFAYSMSDQVYLYDSKEGFHIIRHNKYDHLVYNIDDSNTIVVSKPSIFWVDILISFSYVFSFYFVVLILLLFITRISPLSLKMQWNFKNRIQIATTSLLFFSLVLIGIGTVYFSIQQYKDRHYEILEEKIQSVYVELIHKLEYETDLHSWSSEGYHNLNALLQKFSNVFFTDINLYDENGYLLATSRSEIFNMGLIGKRMNAEAFVEMAVQMRSEFVHRENIGEMGYLSAYVPFVNMNNNFLAYLNLPYFTRQDELTREITNLVVAIINILVLLSLLSFTIAVFMSNTITLPLRLIQQNIARISLSEKNEKIRYNRDDEIGSLVSEYNLMVDQLQQSAELLARSERETAWREMAKQIAHEIKNPLTPMKLSVQHLKRLSKERSDDWERNVEKISHTLIEQIDDLSAIATEFSNFAKMPVASVEKVNLVQKLKNIRSLFTEYDRIQLNLELNGLEEVIVYADREQLTRVFINLIKNAIQSIPEGREGMIDFELQIKNSKALVSVRDNGKGIPKEVRDKLFQPNFTTKSSGMGLGLAIVRNIVNSSGGRVYYETETGKGSTFYVELPVIQK